MERKSFSPFLILASSKRIVSGNLLQMACVVKSVNANIISAAYLEVIDSAIRRNEPRRSFRVAVDGADEMES